MRFRFLFAVLCISCFGMNAATWNAASVARADVAAAIDLASDGDTVVIPAGTASWTTNLTITKGITLQGSGTNSTFIVDDIPNGSGIFGALGSVIQLSTTSNKFYRITGIHFPTNTVRTAEVSTGIIYVSGVGKMIRIDNCHFMRTQYRTRHIQWYNATCGVVDHCVFDRPWIRAVDFIHNTWGGLEYGYGSWAEPATWGTTNTVMIEDCYFKGNSSATAFTDAFDGARYGVRHCTMEDGHLDAHEGGSLSRSTRQVEMYFNTLIESGGVGLGLSLRGGSCVVFSNTMVGTYGTLAYLYNYRSKFVFPTWEGSNGTNIWDNNDPIARETGTFDGVDGATTTMTDSSKSWTTNQWRGFTVQNNAAGATNAYGQDYGLIMSNTGDTLTTLVSDQASIQLNWTNGNTYSIYYITNAFDAPGMGQDGVEFTSYDPPEPQGWPEQALEPCYQWGNDPSSVKFGAYPIIRANVHYYDDTVRPDYTPLEYPHPLTLIGSDTSQPTRGKSLERGRGRIR